MKNLLLLIIVLIIGILLGYGIAGGNAKNIIKDTVSATKRTAGFFTKKTKLEEGNKAFTESLGQKNGGVATESEQKNQEINTRTTAVSNNLVGDNSNKEKEQEQQKNEIILYYGDESALGVVPFKYIVDKSQMKDIKYIFEMLKTPPENEKVFSQIPKTAKLLSFSIENGICELNLSEEFVTDNRTGSSGELITIDSIVNTLTEIEEISKVQFLIDGKKQESYINLIFNEPFERNESSIIIRR